MRFSIAMGTFNGARFIDQQLESLAKQTALPDELVVCDDGSSDATLAIVERFATQAPFRVRIERNPHQLGVSDNFLKAASLCSGDWVAYCDQDDIWLPHKLETVAKLVEQRPSLLLAAHRAELVDEQSRRLGRALHVPAVSRLTVIPRLGTSFWIYPYGFTIAFDRRLVRQFPIQARPVSSHDRWVFTLANALGEVALLPEVLALYRRHQDNVSQFQPPRPLSAGIRDPNAAEVLADAAETYLGLAKYLEHSTEAAPAESAEALCASAAAYRRMAAGTRDRARLYADDATSVSLLAGYLSTLLRGTYRAYHHGGVGWRAGIRDLARTFLRRRSCPGEKA